MIPMALPVRSRLAALGVAATNGLVRRLGRGAGTVAGGRVGLRLDPRLLERLARGREIIVVTGTNGKTTTSALVREGWGGDVAANTTGANMPAGHVAALVASRSSRVVLEVDEAWLDVVVAAASPVAVVLLNLSRDQLDRASEVRQLAVRWRAITVAHPALRIIANASDPLVVFAVGDAENVEWISVPHGWREDARSCPVCTAALTFGDHWSCSCGFTQPTATTIVDERGAISVHGEVVPLDLGIPGFFNRVNATFALRALAVVGQMPGAVTARLATVTSVQGRYGVRTWAGRTIRLLLAKNPAGVGVLLSELDEADGELWIAINAHVADGRDPSWIYDAPFEHVQHEVVTCLGERRLDIATRLTYAGKGVRVVDDIDELASGEGPVTLIANYTAFREWFERSAPC